MQSNILPRPILLPLLLALSFGETCCGQDPIADKTTEAKYETYYERASTLFAWFDTLQLFPLKEVQLVWHKNPIEIQMGVKEPKFGIVLDTRDGQLRYLSLDLWKAVTAAPAQKPRDLFSHETSNYVTLEEAVFLFRRFHERPKHRMDANEGGISPMVLQGFVLAYLADRLGQPQLSKQLVQLLVERKQAQKLTQEQLSNAVAYRFLTQFIFGFSNLEFSWTDLAQQLREFDSRLPQHAYSQRVASMLKALENLAEEEISHQADWKAIELGEAKLSRADQIRELVFQLRNQAGTPMASHSLGNPLNDARTELSPAGRLISMGYAGVPALIEALDDRTFTRSPTQYSPDPLGNVFTVAEVAVYVLSEIAKRDFRQHLQPTAMFDEPEGLAIAKQEILQWWRDYEELGELGLLKKRIRTAAGFEVIDIAEKLTEKYPAEALAILRPELQRLDGNSCFWVVEIMAATPTREMEPLLRELMNRKELSIRAAAASALLRLGHHQVIPQLIDSYREMAASPKLYEKYTSWSFADANGVNNLVSFLSECNRVEAIQAMADSLEDVQPELAETVLHRVIAAFGKGKTDWTRAVPPSSPAVRQAVIELYLNALRDQRRRPSTFVEIGPDGRERPHLEQRICDTAGQYLANLLSPQAKIDYQLDEAGKDAFYRQIEDRVRTELLPVK